MVWNTWLCNPISMLLFGINAQDCMMLAFSWVDYGDNEYLQSAGGPKTLIREGKYIFYYQ